MHANARKVDMVSICCLTHSSLMTVCSMAQKGHGDIDNSQKTQHNVQSRRPRRHKLTPSRVFIRIRPQALHGGHAQHTDDDTIQGKQKETNKSKPRSANKTVKKTKFASRKMIHSWDDSSVTIGWTCSGGSDFVVRTWRGSPGPVHLL